MPLHRQVRGDDLLTHNHRQQPRCGADGFQVLALLAVKHKGCRRTRSQDNPSGIYGRRPSDNLRRKACCGQQAVNPL